MNLASQVAVESPVRTVTCNLCGADDYTVRFPRGFAQLHRIVTCNRCGLMYANPQESVDCQRFESYLWSHFKWLGPQQVAQGGLATVSESVSELGHKRTIRPQFATTPLKLA
jgi:ribosomal protein S27E